MVPTRIVSSSAIGSRHRHTCASTWAALYCTIREWQALYCTVPLPSVDLKKPSQRPAAAKDVNADPERDYLLALGDRLREARARRGMSRKVLAADSGVSERYLAQLEAELGNVSILLLPQIASALELSRT